MPTCTPSSTEVRKTLAIPTLLRAAGAVLIFLATSLSANTQVPLPSSPVAQAPQSFALTDPKDLTVTGGKAEAVDYQGRKAVRLSTDSTEEVFALLNGVQFQDGTIEADIALKTTTPPGVHMPGFIGIAFRTGPDPSHYDMFYLRPGNSRSENQAMRNHSVQYVAAPGFDWYTLRRQWPWIYESWADLQPERWTHVKIEAHGRNARLYVDGSDNPSLIVNGLRGENLQGGVALWGYTAEEAYFSNAKITPAPAEAVSNGGESSGTWDVDYASDRGSYKGSMNLQRSGNTVTGTWSGAFGQNQPVTGTWRNGYVELTFNGDWSSDQPGDKPGPMTATLAGWIDGDSAQGRMKVEGKADGQWTAVRKK